MTNNFDDLYAQFKADVRRAFDSPFSRKRRIAKRMAKADERLAEVRATRAMLMSAISRRACCLCAMPFA